MHIIYLLTYVQVIDWATVLLPYHCTNCIIVT